MYYGRLQDVKLMVVAAGPQGRSHPLVLSEGEAGEGEGYNL